MFLLDTNVISELRKVRAGKGHPAVVTWAEGIEDKQLFISVITIRELYYGVLLMERKDEAQGRLLRQWLEAPCCPALPTASCR